MHKSMKVDTPIEDLYLSIALLCCYRSEVNGKEV